MQASLSWLWRNWDAGDVADVVEPLNEEADDVGGAAPLLVPAPELEPLERQSNPARVGFAGLVEPARGDAATEGELGGAALSGVCVYEKGETVGREGNECFAFAMVWSSSGLRPAGAAPAAASRMMHDGCI